jgi:hypothetical protein
MGMIVRGIAGRVKVEAPVLKFLEDGPYLTEMILSRPVRIDNDVIYIRRGKVV